MLRRQPGILEIPRGTLLETQMLSELTCMKFPVVASRPSVVPEHVHSGVRVMLHTLGDCLVCEYTDRWTWV